MANTFVGPRTEMRGGVLWVQVEDASHLLRRDDPHGPHQPPASADGWVKEADVYATFLRASPPLAKALEDWVVGHALPSIREAMRCTIAGEVPGIPQLPPLPASLSNAMSRLAAGRGVSN